MPIPAAGGAAIRAGHALAIRFAYHGCTNRPFFHVVIQNASMDRDQQCIEQIGTFDPMPNSDNQKLLGVNIERLEYWMGRGARPSRAVARTLGLVGLYDLQPETIMSAWENRRKMAAETAKAAATAEATHADSPPESTSATP